MHFSSKKNVVVPIGSTLKGRSPCARPGLTTIGQRLPLIVGHCSMMIGQIVLLLMLVLLLLLVLMVVLLLLLGSIPRTSENAVEEGT